MKFTYLFLIGIINVFSSECTESSFLIQKLDNSYLIALKGGNTYCDIESKSKNIFKINNFCSLDETKESLKKLQNQYSTFEQIKNVVISIPLKKNIDFELEKILTKNIPEISIIWNLKNSYIQNGQQNTGYCDIDFCHERPSCKVLKNDTIEINFSQLKYSPKADSLILEINNVLNVKISNILEFAQYYNTFYNSEIKVPNSNLNLLVNLFKGQNDKIQNATLNKNYELALSEIVKGLLATQNGIYFDGNFYSESLQILESLKMAKNCPIKPVSFTFLVGRLSSTKFSEDFNKEVNKQLLNNYKCMK